jgi:hypothetical protein
MNPDVVATVDQLTRGGVLSLEQARHFGRVASGELVSVRAELRVLLYAGVLAITAGVGVLVRQNLDQIGPVTIALALWMAAFGALFWVFRHAAPFTWDASPSSHLAFDYVLLLAVLLIGSALAYLEVQFTPLGAAWAHHLLLMSLIAAALAVRFDSRVVASIALTTFAAWRGVSSVSLEGAFWRSGDEAEVIRVNAMVTGILFVGLGAVLLRSGRKPHFQPLTAHLGWLLILGGVVSGIVDTADAGLYRLAALVVGGALAVFAFRRGRFARFGMGLVAAYVGGSALMVAAISDVFFGMVWFAVTGVAVLAGLLWAHHAIRKRQPA